MLLNVLIKLYKSQLPSVSEGENTFHKRKYQPRLDGCKYDQLFLHPAGGLLLSLLAEIH